MTISTTDNRTSTVGDASTTAFSFPYLFHANDDLRVILVTTATGVETAQTITTHYTVTGAGVTAGGTVTMVTPPATTETLVIIREEQFTQTLDLVENDPFPSDLVEQQFDTLTMLAQQMNTELGRAVKLADGDSTGVDLTLPTPVALKTFRWNAGLTALEQTDDPAVSATAAAASAAAALVSENAAAADLVLTNADVVLTNADVVLTNADVVLTNADVVLTNADVVTAGNSETAAAASASAAAASAAGIFWKEPVVNATTANITLSGEQTIDGILTSTSRILVKNQSDASENGAYVTAAGAWARAAPLDTWNEHVGAAVIVSSGSVHGDSAWICTVDAGGTLETTAITWAALSQVYTSATTTTEGIIELATLAEVATGSDTSRAVTAAGAAAHYSPEARTITADTSTALNSALTHEGGVVTMNNASANVFTIEPNATIAHSTGAQIDVIMLGAGVTSITGDTGVTLNGVSAGTGAMTARYGAVTLLRISSDVWTASGAIGTVA